MGQNSPYFLKRDQFRHAIRQGMGRALLHLRIYPNAVYAEELLAACQTWSMPWISTTPWNYELTNYEHADSARYLWRAIEYSGLAAGLKSRLIKAFFAAEDRDVLGQLYFVVAKYALLGDAPARQALKERFRQNPPDYAEVGVGVLQKVFDDEGVVFVAETLGERLAKAEIQPRRFKMFGHGPGVINVGIMNRIIKPLPDKRGFIANLVELMNAEYSEDGDENQGRRGVPGHLYPKKKRLIWNWPFEQLRASYRGADDFVDESDLQAWPHRADEREVLKAAECLRDAKDDLDRRLGLIIFGGKVLYRLEVYPYPLDPQPLIDFTEHADLEIQSQAYQALSYIKHKKVRALYERHANESSLLPNTVKLLQQNYALGDTKRVLSQLISEYNARMTTPTRGDYLWLYHAQRGVIEVLDLVRDDIRQEALIWMYEHSIVDRIRGSIRQKMIASRTATPLMKKEAAFDRGEHRGDPLFEMDDWCKEGPMSDDVVSVD